MDSNYQKSQLGGMLKSILKDRSISMRKLSKLTGIDTATISRIINGKQRANINHIEKLSRHLNVPMEVLLKSAGYNIGESNTDSSEILNVMNSLNYKCDIDKIKAELEKYEQYALTPEGKNIIYKDFQKKLEGINGSGFFVEKLQNMYSEFVKKDISREKQAILGSCLLYFILSADIIPDYVFPIGYIDDIKALELVEQKMKS
ncbi:MAG: helix-turn-helix domain-containing protein [Clostridium sp.]|jgi:transcriptional regulator with XRE-family HTH domain|uniref:helix-turn-helix domain-containing protein n=1 Tax=Clostridium sp. TaxID=1506 RepID=UPI0025BE934B|nr:helix-turn-helix domain-containing protein [Clostridium sp.]MCH3964665.1 helix-turn-helix domain-containing protein [Clostridium sp.]MCI1715136.1 helix-turn-helix domain-containing protein [Clostridium sp.]MCI1799398.1 helix-turn-helix domain-containing protein [Clostridium sp.]MCI1813319.1 helix-turn-helix domain-containing protein [Clostridium sp.]MCI1870210.1 helix-turn-helix domain-containing protein [Clostridium sp.]